MDSSPTQARPWSRRVLLHGVGAVAVGWSVPAWRRPKPQVGEAPPGLTGIVWQWQDTLAPDGTVVWRPDQPARYTITFGTDGTLAIQADCNRARGAYARDGATLTLQIGGVTRMRCATDSLMDRFLGELEYASALRLTPDALALGLTAGDVMMFTPAPNLPATPGAA
jgi:heat shock protein HslJ